MIYFTFTVRCKRNYALIPIDDCKSCIFNNEVNYEKKFVRCDLEK